MTGGKLKLSKLYRNVISAAEDEAAAHGGTVDFDLCGRHPRVHFHLAGQMRVIPFAGTPRVAAHVPTWMRQRIRQKAKEMMHGPRNPQSWLSEEGLPEPLSPSEDRARSIYTDGGETSSDSDTQPKAGDAKQGSARG